jgi:formylmethanofuran dehydrogenase subunit E
MALAAARLLELPLRAQQRRLEVTVETARCATDAIAATTGCSLGQRTLSVDERGEMAARFLDTQTGHCVRVAARDEAKVLARLRAPAGCPAGRAGAAYLVMPDELPRNHERPGASSVPEQFGELGALTVCGVRVTD